MIIMGIGLIACILFMVFIIPVISTQHIEKEKPVTVHSAYNAPFGKLFLATLPSDQSQNVTLNRVISQKNDMIDYWNGSLEYTGNITPTAEASQVAQKILDNYGGLPIGAGPLEAETEYIETYNLSTGQVVERIPDSTVINCQRFLDDKPVIGGYIRIELGSNGELQSLKKVWRNVTPAGTVQVIPASEAFQKILRGEVYSTPLKCTCDLTVDTIILAYWEKGYNETQDYLEPVWDFKGTLSSGGTYRYIVPALKSSGTSDYLYGNTAMLPAGIAPDNLSSTLAQGNRS